MPDVPIIMLSGHGERWRVVEAVRLGVNEYLIKPVSAKALDDRLVSITLQPRPTVQLGDYYGPELRKLAGDTVEDVDLATSLVPSIVVEPLLFTPLLRGETTPVFVGRHNLR